MQKQKNKNSPGVSLFFEFSWMIGNKNTMRYAETQLTIVVKGIKGGCTISGMYSQVIGETDIAKVLIISNKQNKRKIYSYRFFPSL